MSTSSSKVGKASDETAAAPNPAPAPAAERPARTKSPTRPATERGGPISFEINENAEFRGPGFLRTFGSFVCSSVLHMLILIALGLWGVQIIVQDSANELAFIQETHQDELTQIMDESMIAGISTVN